MRIKIEGNLKMRKLYIYIESYKLKEISTLWEERAEDQYKTIFGKRRNKLIGHILI